MCCVCYVQGGAAVVPFRRVGVLESGGGEVPVCLDREDSAEEADVEERGTRRPFPNLGRGRGMGQLCRRPEGRGVDGGLCSGVPGRETAAVATGLFGPGVSAGSRGSSNSSAAPVVAVCVEDCKKSRCFL